MPDLEAMPTVETLTPAVFGGEVVQQVKQIAPPFRYSLLRSTGRLAIPTRVLYEERTGDEWNVIAERSYGYLFMPMEQAAAAARARGDRVVALLLVHAMIEAVMRSDPGAEFTTEEKFADVAKGFRKRLIERELPHVDPEAMHREIVEVNQRRNRVIHEQLVRDGWESTNARLTDAEAEAWMRTYAAALDAVMEFVSL